MKRIIKHSRLRFAPTVLDGAALLACNDDPTTETQTITATRRSKRPPRPSGLTNIESRATHQRPPGARA